MNIPQPPENEEPQHGAVPNHPHDEVEVPMEVYEKEGDANHERIITALTEIQIQLDEDRKNADTYLFNQQEFIAALDHIVADQQSALKKEKIDSAQWAERFNRWFVFCDAVLHLGFTCRYKPEAMQKEDYETVFRSLALSKVFETTFLKPRRIRVELTHKSDEVKKSYPWLAMPCLIVTDEKGEEQLIALTPSPYAPVWWLDILTGFHSTFEWQKRIEEEQEDYEAAPYPALGLYQGD